MDFWYYIMTPFTWLLTVFYQVFNSYGLALIVFALVVKVILFPLSLKGKKSMIQMNMLSGRLQKLQKQYGKDQARYNMEVQKLYDKEGVNPMGGCLWSFLPLLILLPLYAIIRQPLKYMMGMTYEQVVTVGNTVLNWASVAAENGWIREAAELTEATAKAGYNQLYLASLITPENVAAVQAAAGTTLKDVFSINFSFLGVNLSLMPQLKFWVDGLMGFGLFLVPVVSALTSILFSVVMMRTNNMNNQNAQANQTNKSMMWLSPVMSLWIGFAMPAALSIYWIANNVLGLAQEIICGKLLKKDYEKAAEEARLREIEEKEEEKRLRREKAEQRAREAEEARKNKGKKKEKAAEEDKMTPQQREASRVGIRQYARGRAYDPDRYGGVTPYYDPEQTPEEPTKEEEPKKEPETAAKSDSPAAEETAPASPAEEGMEADLDRINAELDAAIEDENKED